MVEVRSQEEKSLLLAGYVLGELSSEEGHLLAQMLAAEPALHEELAELQASCDRAYGATAEPPAGLKGAVLSEFDRMSTAPVRSERNTFWTGSNRRWAWRGIGALAAGLIAALGVQNQHLRQRVDVLIAERDALVEPQLAGETINVALSSTGDEGSPGQVSLVIDPADLNAVLVAEGLTPLGSDRVYALWTVVQPNVPVTTDEKGAILTAVFTVDADGAQTQEIDLPRVFESVEDVKAIAVSVESADAPQKHQSSPILSEQL